MSSGTHSAFDRYDERLVFAVFERSHVQSNVRVRQTSTTIHSKSAAQSSRASTDDEVVLAFSEFHQNGETVSVVSRDPFRDHDADVQ